MFTTEILLDNPGDLCTSHDKQRKICRTWFVEYCGGHIVRVGHGDILVYLTLFIHNTNIILNSGQFGDNHNFVDEQKEGLIIVEN